MASPTSTRKTSRVRLRPHDAFDLIRLLARSQSDPRKAIAELVQNSLDAGARHIELTWFNKNRERALRIRDDGEGVFPDLPREEALRRIAHTIGYSHKRDLTPIQRREQMVLGRYGIGLIGFWCVGKMLEMKSRVGGERAWTLRMLEDRAQGRVEEDRSRKVVDENTWTEVSILGIHPAAVPKIRPPRLQAYLANELRGQLLEREAVVRITDRVARGRARKLFVVEPRPYLGRPLEQWRTLEVPGFESARVELYAVAPDEERHGVVALACGGTVVLDDIADIDGADQRRDPWDRGLLEGVIDFPELYVAPGSRRGFAHDEPVTAFLEVLRGLERELLRHFEDEKRRRAALRNENLAKDIRKAFRLVANRLPSYDFFPVRGEAAAARGASAGDGGTVAGAGAAGAATEEAAAEGGEALAANAAADGEVEAAAEPRAQEGPQDAGHLFPPGPLGRVQIRPARLRLPPLATRRLLARPLDVDGRPCAGDVVFAWSLQGPGELQADGGRATYTAPDADEAMDAAPVVKVVATQGETLVSAELVVRVDLGGAGGGRTSGIPEPRPVSAPGATWRSRLVDGRWEYNAEHRDYLAASDTEAQRLRYLVNLFAKEIVLRNFGGPGHGDVLERMVEVLTYLDKGARRGG
jgi:hypothetical protein